MIGAKVRQAFAAAYDAARGIMFPAMRDAATLDDAAFSLARETAFHAAHAAAIAAADGVLNNPRLAKTIAFDALRAADEDANRGAF